MKKFKGFTLIELLVVIAIIGILASVAIVNLNSARRKAHAANVQSALSSLSSAVIVCHDDGLELTPDGAKACGVAPLTTLPTAGSAICAGSETEWPDITTDDNWAYTEVSAGVACTSAAATSDWSFRADDSTSPRYITCDDTGCEAHSSGGYADP